MIPWSVIERSIRENRCCFSGCGLKVGEFLVSEIVCPGLYGGGFRTDDKEKVSLIVTRILENFVEFDVKFATRSDCLLKVERFFGLCLKHGQKGDESYVHAYVYIFWKKIVKAVKLQCAVTDTPHWCSSKFGIFDTILDGDAKLISQRLRSNGSEVDLFTYDKQFGNLCLVEIKRGEVDDRAIGQILRYFNTGWALFRSREFRLRGLSYLSIIVIANQYPRPFLSALPIHFLSLVELVKYDIDEFGIPRFYSARNIIFEN